MTSDAYGGQLGASVSVDLCPACQVFWFDTHESLQLSPAATLRLFQIIGDKATAPRATLRADIRCPRCTTRLLETHDMQRQTKFQYLRCPRGDGRLITFYDFLREKDFIRPLSPAQLEELRRNIQTVNCANCGAPIDLTSASTCGHCGSPLSMLDLHQAERLIAALRQADSERQQGHPTLALDLALARQQVEHASLSSPSASGPLGDGIVRLLRVLTSG